MAPRRPRLLPALLLLLQLLPGIAPDAAPAARKPSAPGGTGPVSVRAVFSRYLAPPGKLAQVKGPGRILFDPVAQETFVADLGNNRVLVFDSNHVFRFQFFCNEHVAAPQDLAVAGDGTIFVLGMAEGAWRIVRFDYDGRFLSHRPIPAAGDREPAEPSSMAAGRDGSLFLLDDPAHEVLVMDTAGRLIRRFGTVPGLPAADRKDVIYGSLSARDSLLFLPLASFGTVSVFHQDGRHLRNIGSKGSATGEMSFPVAAALNGDGILHVLDKNRFNVVCFTLEGRPLGEFGGKGVRAGWFYHPQRIAINARNQIVVAQIMNNAIQVCDPPAFLLQDSLDLRP